MNGNFIPSIRIKDLDITCMKTKSHKYDFCRCTYVNHYYIIYFKSYIRFLSFVPQNLARKDNYIQKNMQKLMNTIINEMN